MNCSVRHLIALFLFALAALTAPTWQPTATAQGIRLKAPFDPVSARAIPGRVIVKLTADAAAGGITVSALAELQPSFGLYRSGPLVNPVLSGMRLDALDGISRSTTDARGLSRIAVVEYSALCAPQEVAFALSEMPGVEYAEPMFPRRLHYATNDPAASQLWYLDVIGARSAWDEVRADSTVVIAIIDAGIDPAHEDLAAAIWHNDGEMGPDGAGGDRSSNGVDDDANGYVDDWQGYDFAGADGHSPDNDPDPARESHGTEMAGIAGAIGDNARGTVGVAFGARLMSLKITNEPESTLDAPELFNTHEAILYAAKMGAHVINCSWGDLGRMRSEQEIIDAATEDYGALVVASAGNSYNDDYFYPASYDGVLSVGAVENGDAKASFSNFNYRVDISAPGTFIYAPELSNRYRYGQGTSHAAAVVSGAAALVLSRFPQLSPAQVVELLRATSDDNSTALGEYAGKLGAGRVNVFNAMLDGETIASARVSRYTAIDAGGDGVLDPGERVTLRTDIVNHLAAATDVTATLAPASAGVVVEGADVDLGAMAAGQSTTTPDGIFRFIVPSGAAENSTVTLKVTVRTPTRVNDSYIVLRVAPTFMTTDLNNITATFNSTGNIGYDGTNRELGDGFHAFGGKDLIYHAGLMIGTDAAHLSDVVRRGPMSMGAADGLRLVRPYRLSTSSDGTVQIGRAAFSDAHRDAAQRVGVDVDMETYEFADALDRDYVLVVYAIRNSSGARLENLHAGLYIDWDVEVLGEGDVATLDDTIRLGYVTNEGVDDVVAGAALVSDGALAFNAVDNNAIGISTEFNSTQKWQLLGNGVGDRTTTATDAGMVIGAGPFALEPGATRKVAFMLGARANLDSLRASTVRATARYGVIASTGTEDSREPSLPITGISPNPARSDAHLELSLTKGAPVHIRILDVHGATMLSTFEGRLEAGDHRIKLDIAKLPDGVYFVEVIADNAVRRGRFVKLVE